MSLFNRQVDDVTRLNDDVRKRVDDIWGLQGDEPKVELNLDESSVKKEQEDIKTEVWKIQVFHLP